MRHVKIECQQCVHMSNTGTSCNEKGRNISCYEGANSYNILMNKTKHLTKRYEKCRHLTAAQ